MKTIELVDKLYESGDLKQLVDHGLVSVNIYEWRKIYKSYLNRLEAGRSKLHAKQDVSDTFDVSLKTVYRVVSRMEYEKQLPLDKTEQS